MKCIKTTGKFRRDLKRYINYPDKLKKLYALVELLQKGEPIPKANKPHLLSGNYRGYMECHIENDFLLIWSDEEEDAVYLVRLGSHSELFGV